MDNAVDTVDGRSYGMRSALKKSGGKSSSVHRVVKASPRGYSTECGRFIEYDNAYRPMFPQPCGLCGQVYEKRIEREASDGPS